MTREERERIIREFNEARKLVRELNSLTHRIEVAAERAIDAYAGKGEGNGAN